MVEIKKEVFTTKTDFEEITEQFATDSIEGMKEKSIFKLDNGYDWELLKKTSRYEYNENSKIKFFINKNIKVNGKVTNKENETLQQITLLREFTIFDEEEEEYKNKIIFLDEQYKQKKKDYLIGSYEKDFWIYKLKTKNKEYLLFMDSDDYALDLEEYTIEGTLVDLMDFKEMSAFSKIRKKLPLIFVHSAYKRIIKFNCPEDMIMKCDNIKLNKYLHRYIFTHDDGYGYEFPDIVEKLVVYWLLSGNKKGFPLHLMIIGEAGTGKSTIMESLHNKTGETNAIFEGTTSTFKALIPSFRGNSPTVGHLISSNRFCFIDEFLRVLMRVDREDRQSYLTFLNTLLEHKERMMGSGNSSFTGKMTAKMLSVTNPVFQTKKIISLLHKFEESITFLSRILIFYQTDEHLEKIVQSKEGDLKNGVKSIKKEDFISILDYITQIDSKYDIKRFKELYNAIRITLKLNTDYKLVKDMFEARYFRHLELILDGIIKRRCILQLDPIFEAKEEDYEELKIFMSELLRSWGIELPVKEESIC